MGKAQLCGWGKICIGGFLMGVREMSQEPNSPDGDNPQSAVSEPDGASHSFRSNIFLLILSLLSTSHVGALLSFASGRGILATFVVLLFTLLVVSATLILILFVWARNQESRKGQFSIATMLLVLVIVGTVLAMMRWFVEGNWESHGIAGTSRGERYFVVFMAIFIGWVFSAPLLIRCAEFVVWHLARAVRRQTVRRWLRRYLPTRQAAQSDPFALPEPDLRHDNDLPKHSP